MFLIRIFCLNDQAFFSIPRYMVCILIQFYTGKQLLLFFVSKKKKTFDLQLLTWPPCWWETGLFFCLNFIVASLSTHIPLIYIFFFQIHINGGGRDICHICIIMTANFFFSIPIGNMNICARIVCPFVAFMTLKLGPLVVWSFMDVRLWIL